MGKLATVWIGLWAIVLLAASGQVRAAADLVLVAGATGGTGQFVVRELAAAGYRVRALVRDPAKARATLGDQVEYAVGDVRQRATLDAALKGARFAISTIGATRKDPANSPEFVDFAGVQNLADAAAAAKLDQLVIVSSVGVTQPDHPLNKMFNNVLLWKARGEDAVRASGVTYTIVRPGGLTNTAAGQAGLRVEQGDRGKGFIARADVARVCVAALKSPGARNRTFEVFSAPVGSGADWDALFAPLRADEARP